MTPTIDHYLNQWARYKVALIIFFAINVFSVILALVLSVNYFALRHNFANQQLQTITNLEITDQALSQLSHIRTEIAGRKTFSVRTTEEETHMLQLLSHTLELKNLLQQLHTGPVEHDLTVLISTFKNQSQAHLLREQLTGIKQQLWLDLKSQIKSNDNKTRLLIVTGLLTLIFGLILPSFIIYLMSQGLNHIRIEMQNTVFDFIKNWNITRDNFGDEAFKNVEFWLQIILLIGSTGGRMSSHPVAKISSELAHIIRLELQKKNSVKPAA